MFRIIFLFFLVSHSIFSFAQSSSDTLQLSLKQADEIILKKNLVLIAAQYNVNAAEAFIHQAKLWDNPVLNTDQNIYDGKFFRHDNVNGTFYVQVMQTLRSGGKRGYSIALAKDNQQIAQQQFYDVMRSMHYTVHSDMIELTLLTTSESLYKNQLDILNRLAGAMDAQLKAGNISQKENLRVKATLFSLQQDLNVTRISMLPLQSELRLLLQLNDNVVVAPVFRVNNNLYSTEPKLDSLLSAALTARPEVQIANLSLAYQQHNYKFQKALAVPDVSAGVEFDQRSSYAPNLYGLAISVPLPVFNRNQGNIKSAQYTIQQQEALTTQVQSKVHNEVITAYNNYIICKNAASPAYRSFVADYQNIFNKMIQSYSERQISFLELSDYLQAYKDTRLKISEQEYKLLQAAETVNYTTNITIIPIN